MTNSTNRLTEAQAASMWDDLRDAFSNLEEKLIAIIQAKAWEPLGYESFAEAWTDRMQGFRLVGELRAHVVYQMLAEGERSNDISAWTGVGAGSVADLARQRANGVPAEAASLVRQHLRRRNPVPYRVIVEFDPQERAVFADACKRLETTMEAEAAKVLREHFQKLARKSMREAS